jgi:hypothetical protein
MRSVTLLGGRTVADHPDLHTVEAIVAWVTLGFTAPGVHFGSGMSCPFFEPM